MGKGEFINKRPSVRSLFYPLLALAFLLVASACARSTSTEFPSFVYTSSTSLNAYKMAVANPDALSSMPCYCGCGTSLEHKNLKECFIKPDGSLDDHAATCDLCNKEVLDVARWLKEGKSLKEIREGIDAKYSSFGNPTDTPPVSSPSSSPSSLALQ